MFEIPWVDLNVLCIHLQKVEEWLREADGVGGDRDGVGEEEHEADGAAQRRAQRARYHVVHAAGRDLKRPEEFWNETEVGRIQYGCFNLDLKAEQHLQGFN